MIIISNAKAMTVAASLATALLTCNAQAGDGHNPLTSWAKGASAAIDDVMIYPDTYVRKGAEGTLTYRVTIDADGDVQSAERTDMKGNRTLSGLARRTIMKANWPALSDEMDRDELTFAVRLNYQVASSAKEYNRLMRQPRITTQQIAHADRGPATASVTILSDAN